MTTIQEIELELEVALRKTLSDLMQDFPTHKFYYFTLTTVGEAIAWTFYMERRIIGN